MLYIYCLFATHTFYCILCRISLSKEIGIACKQQTEFLLPHRQMRTKFKNDLPCKEVSYKLLNYQGPAYLSEAVSLLRIFAKIGVLQSLF